MPSLKEIKNHIASVRSTLKITSAMKMVASAKLRKAQQAIEAMRPYEAALHKIMLEAGGASASPAGNAVLDGNADSSVNAVRNGNAVPDDSPVILNEVKNLGVAKTPGEVKTPVAIVAVSSNSSLCGGFNANVIRETRARIAEIRGEGKEVIVYSVGRKMSDAMRKDGYRSPQDCGRLAGSPAYEDAAALAQVLADGFAEGKYERVELIYNHFVSTSTQKVTVETYLPFSMDVEGDAAADDVDYILEPDRKSLLDALLPKVMRLKLYTVMLDSSAAEHAARTIAMQTATDNGQDLLDDLTLQYNKSRQQKITSEILDIAGGSQQGQ